MKIIKLMGLALAALLIVAVGYRYIDAADGIDFVDGTKIPRAWYGPHYFVPDTKTESFTLSADDAFYLINSSGGAITVTLPTPSTLPTGQCWQAILTTAGNAVTWNAGTYSVNGAVSTNEMDAAGDAYIICNNGAGYNFLSRYIH